MNTSIVKNAKEAVHELLSFLEEKNKRAHEIIILRYGLKTGVEKTLAEISRRYSITRERVRQLEVWTISLIKGIETHQSLMTFEVIRKEIASMGYIAPEKELLNSFSKNAIDQKFLLFLLSIKSDFIYLKETSKFRPCWATDSERALAILNALESLIALIDDRDILPEQRILNIFKGFLGELANSADDNMLLGWLSISKEIGKNSSNEWGKTSSRIIWPKTLADYAYLVMKEHSKPMHFLEIARGVKKTFHKKFDIRTCHNELIRKKAFVLVGRGTYALAELGYENGTVQDVIQQILKEYPLGLPRDTIIKKVLEKRVVKKNTICVSLWNKKLFKKIGGDEDAVYVPVMKDS